MMLDDNLIRDLIDRLRDGFVDYDYETYLFYSKEPEAIQCVKDCFEKLKRNQNGSRSCTYRG
jgi:hypothetical protein